MNKWFLIVTRNEPGCSKTYKLVCGPSEDSDQPAPPCSLIRLLATHSMGSQGPNDSLFWLSGCQDEQGDLSLHMTDIQSCTFCFARAEIMFLNHCAPNHMLVHRCTLLDKVRNSGTLNFGVPSKVKQLVYSSVAHIVYILAQQTSDICCL